MLELFSFFLCTFAVCLLNTMSEYQKRLGEIKLPLYVVHGDTDALCELSGAKLLHEKATSSDKTLEVKQPIFKIGVRKKL